MTAFSIIICTHNPEKNIFSRLLNAVKSFSEKEDPFEVIIVDNNSKEKIAGYEEVRSLKKNIPTVKVIEEKNPGLTNARIAGIKEAKYDWIIFFDDDNEPSEDYLQEAVKVIDKYPEVGAWGPGNIEVIFDSHNSSKWIEKYKYLFQERNSCCDYYGFEKRTKDYYPDGTGLCIKKVVAEDYVENVKKGNYTLTDRNGKRLTSGGDLQLILNAPKLGLGVGRGSKLNMKHNISKRKLHLSSLMKLIFGVESCNYIAHSEVLGWGNDGIKKFEYSTNVDFIKTIYHVLIVKKGSTRDLMIRLSAFCGQQQGIYLLKNEKQPLSLISFFSYFIKK